MAMTREMVVLRPRESAVEAEGTFPTSPLELSAAFDATTKGLTGGQLMAKLKADPAWRARWRALEAIEKVFLGADQIRSNLGGIPRSVLVTVRAQRPLRPFFPDNAIQKGNRDTQLPVNTEEIVRSAVPEKAGNDRELGVQLSPEKDRFWSLELGIILGLFSERPQPLGPHGGHRSSEPVVSWKL